MWSKCKDEEMEECDAENEDFSCLSLSCVSMKDYEMVTQSWFSHPLF